MDFLKKKAIYGYLPNVGIVPSNAWIEFLMFDWAALKRDSSSFDLNLVVMWGGNVVWRLRKVRGHHVKGRCRREAT